MLPAFKEVFMISATENDGVVDVENYLYDNAVEREWEFDAETVTEQSTLQRVEEIIREKIYQRLHQEIPYRLEQKNIGWTELAGGALRIDQQLMVETPTQKVTNEQTKTFIVLDFDF
jgi:GTP-binding protein Era